MKPQQKSLAKQLLITAWVIFATACGSLNDTPPSASRSSSTEVAPSDPVEVSNTVQSPKDMATGDVYQLSFQGAESAAIELSGVPSSAEYVLAIANLNSSGSSASLQVSGSENAILNKAVAAMPEEDHEALPDVAAQFHEDLRFQEEVLASESRPVSAGKSMVTQSAGSAVPAEGDPARFQVLSTLSGGSKVMVSATVMYVGSDVICYLDQEVIRRNPDDLSRDDVRRLCADFESRMADERGFFGTESDVDGNGRLIVLMTAQVNKMGAALGGLITGFFYASDLYDPGMEIIHTLVPDSSGIYGQVVPKGFAMANLLPSVLVHEFQHAINYNEHVLVRGGSPEAAIINEGLSHLSEDVLGVGRENYARYETFLNRPYAYGLFSAGSPNLGARGASYLFLRYLMEQSGRGDFIPQLLQTDLSGVANIESAFDGREGFNTFGQFYLRWAATLILGSEGLSDDARYSYQDRLRQGGEGEWQGICLRCEVDDGRGTVLTGINVSSYNDAAAISLQPGGVQFYRVTPDSAKLTLYTASSGNFGAVLVRVK